MFFDDELEPNKKEYEKPEYSGSFDTNEFDHNRSHFEVEEHRIYSRWKYHFLLSLGFIFILSLYYPLFFILIICDAYRLYCYFLYLDSLLSEDADYDPSWHAAQEEGGNSYINIYVFLCYDCLGYLPFGLSSADDFICSEVYEYKNSMGLADKLKIYKKIKLPKNIKLYKSKLHKIKRNKKKKLSFNDDDILNFRYKYNIDISRLNFNKLSFINHINNLNLRKKRKKRKKHINYYLLLNLDRRFTFSNFIRDKKLKENKEKNLY